MKDRIEKLIRETAETCMQWITEKDGAVQFVDPLDHEEISAHYGATHAAAALILYGKDRGLQDYVTRGESLLFSVFSRWEQCMQLPGFHNDFNNFALCALDSRVPDYHEAIEKIVLSTPDSSHDTVNWLPMRWYVNRCRYAWTGDQRYLSCCRSCADKIREATYPDGFIDDRLPKGTSFNLQYDTATVAVMQWLKISGESIDISLETGALLNAVCPDGDINYLGRGTNQIFAWGLWIYLLASGGQQELTRALGYLESRLPAMLKNHNLMLNSFPGKEKYLWWDYHYCSVYTAHFLLWMVLALLDYGKAETEPRLTADGSSGVHIYRNEDCFVTVFDGRKEYLAEYGPVVAAVWTKKYGTICKGTFGPWGGAFGNRYRRPEITLRNFVGILSRGKRQKAENTRLKRLASRFVHSKPAEKSEPKFCAVRVRMDQGLTVSFDVPSSYTADLCVPSLESEVPILPDSGGEPFTASQMIRNQYGWCTVYIRHVTGEKAGFTIR